MRWTNAYNKLLISQKSHLNQYFSHYYYHNLTNFSQRSNLYQTPLKLIHTQNQIQHPQAKLLGFIDNLKDETTLNTLHGKVIKNGSVLALEVGNFVISQYVKFRNLGHARKVFDEMTERDVKTWTILVSGYGKIGLCEEGLGVFREMVREGGVLPNGFTLSSVVKCCGSFGGKEIHGWVLRNGVRFDSVLRNSLLDFYVKVGKAEYAKRLFEVSDGDGVDVVTWNIMIGALMQSGDLESGLDLFRRLPSKDVGTWNTVISGLVRSGSEGTALELLYEMVKARAWFDEFTFTIALGVVSSLSMLKLGKEIHGRLIGLGLCGNEYIRSSLIDMYSKCGVVDEASVVFKMGKSCFVKQRHNVSSELLTMDAVLMSSMVSGYAQNGRWEEAIGMFCNMVCGGTKVDLYTVTTIVSICADYGLLEFGRQIHGLVQKTGYKVDEKLGSSLVDMYSKCGSLEDAQSMFDQTSARNNVLWTSLINGYAFHGHGEKAIRLLKLMKEEGMSPNEVTFVAVLTACSHAGLVDEGRLCFTSMKETYGIRPGVEHYTCMADLFGRAGRLDELEDFIYENEISHLSSVWRAFLSSCRVHKNYNMGKWVSEKLLKLEPMDAEPYVLLSNMCATSDRWEESATIRNSMQRKGVKKHPGQSWIQLNNQVHSFVMGDRSHPQEAEIYSYLDSLISRLKEIGYQTEVDQVMQDVEDEQREMFLCHHSEKLAVAYCIISTPTGTPIRVMKNLRVCNDCHNFLKYTSQLLGRDIIVRDIRRFHIFKNGLCSCGDYW